MLATAEAPEGAVVTGSQGLLGRRIVHELLTAGARRVLGVGRSARTDTTYTHTVRWRGDDVSAPLPDDLRSAAVDPRCGYVGLDVTDEPALRDLLRRNAPDVVVHAAAALRDSSWSALAASNIEAVRAVVEAAAAAGVPRVVLVSSGSVYGAGAGRLPLHEDGPLDPVDLYGVSKHCGEQVARVLARRSGVELVVARVFNLVGPGLQERHLPARLAGLLVEAAATPGPSVLRLGPLDATRDFVDVGDAARAVAALASRPRPPAAVNVASGRETVVQEVFDLLHELTGRPPVRVERTAGRPVDVPRAVADVERLRAVVGDPAPTGLRPCLAAMVDYYRDVGRLAVTGASS